MICSDLEIGDKLEIYPHPFVSGACRTLIICKINKYKDDNSDKFNWRRIYFKEILNRWEYFSVYDNFGIEKYGIKIIELGEK